MRLVRLVRSRLALGQEDGIALVLVVLLIALLSVLSVTLIGTVQEEEGNSATAVKRQSAFGAAEAGLDDYISKLVDDHLYYVHYVAKGEATRLAPGGSNVSTSPNTSSSTNPTAWTYGLTWTYPNGKDQWRSLSNGYEYDLEITPPSASQTAVGIVSTGRPAGDANVQDWRVLQVLIKPSSITDYYRIVNGDVGWGNGANLYGKVYSAGNISFSGTVNAYANIYAEGSISGSVTLNNGAQKYDSTTIRSQIKNPINFSDFLTSMSDISRASQLAGIYLNNSSYDAWKLVFSSAGTLTVQGCTKSGGNPVSQTAPSCGTATTYNVPSNGAIYSQQDVIVSGSVKGRVTVASNSNVVVGGNIAPVTPGTDVLGLDATVNLITAGYVPNPFTWQAAVLAQTGTWENDPNSSCQASGGCTMNFTGMSATSDGGSFSGFFATRNYNYDSTLQYLQPPWFPSVGTPYTITLFRELPHG
ncbi:MAG TPA: PilX N-terminal domain-containing pilus assembly protein [Gaiellaceae bacterium]|nr:PilX N-terminal domain-containing pilus assembly protein [Gaiellaceae bacterium]